MLQSNRVVGCTIRKVKGTKLSFYPIPSGTNAFLFVIYVFLLYLTPITAPSKTYSASYSRYYGEYRRQQQHFF